MTVPRTVPRDTAAFTPCAECERLLDIVAHTKPGPDAPAVAHALSSHIISSAHPGAALGGVSWIANHLGPRIVAATAKDS